MSVTFQLGSRVKILLKYFLEMKSILFVVAIACALVSTQAMYSSNSGVVDLDSKNFKKEVINSDEIWLVEFYAPWCGHCQALKPVYEKVAKALKGIVKVGAVDADKDKSAGASYGVQGFPTIKLFGNNKAKPIDYNSGRDEDSIINFVLKEVKKAVKERQNGKANTSNSKSSKKSGGSKASKDGDVVVLTDSNFDQTVMNSKDIWFIEFYAPWCGHCQKLAPEWDEAASSLRGQVKFGKVDATVEKGLASRFQIQGYPTIKYWDYGNKKSKRSGNKYEGGRTASDIKNFAQNLLENTDIEPEVHELTNQSKYEDECTSGICVISFLPNIYESDAKSRNSYIDAIKKTAKAHISKPFAFFWVEAGNNIDLENNLGLGFGFPAVIAVSSKNGKYGIMKGSFSESGLKSFADGLLIGKTSLAPLPPKFEFKKISPWDGKDAPALEEEDFTDDL